jgi:hypothetical protein
MPAYSRRRAASQEKCEAAFVLDDVLAFAVVFCAYIRICGDIYREKCESLLF